MPILISGMALRKAPTTKVGSLVKSALAKQDVYRPEAYTCFIEYPLINITISVSRLDVWDNYIEAATFKENETFNLKLRPARGYTVQHRRYLDGPYQGGYIEKIYFPKISKEESVKDPFDTTLREVWPVLFNSTTNSTCLEVAKYIEDHPCGKYKNDNETVWVREYVSESLVLYPVPLVELPYLR
ncbi:hypothetical protein FOL46_005622 [Perkinsus olseni]|uniref:Uncharacterized protein n=1 Tax=Perkinsus olseni TaxID=32597 RepID=A0A7J6LR19_PEROL|nr:hypothetical protein FOL46_005622 [Perkinsus olseni]